MRAGSYREALGWPSPRRRSVVGYWTMHLYRVMLRASDGSPAVGGGANMLGIRVGIDVRPDASGSVSPGKGGLSVAPDDPARLPPHLRPIRYGGACGLPLFRIHASSIGEMLVYVADPRRPERHGTIDPARTMHVDAYQTSLASTAPTWQEAS